MRASSTVMLLGLMAGCAHGWDGADSDATLEGPAQSNKLANLERAARYPWLDDGVCAVHESTGSWATLIERCYQALDLHRIRFADLDGSCPIAQAGTISADQVAQIVGICLLVQPELVVGAVIVIGVIVVAAAIAAEMSKIPCRCICLGSGAVDGRGRKPMDGPYSPPPGRPTNTLAQCNYACTSGGYAKGICKG